MSVFTLLGLLASNSVTNKNIKVWFLIYNASTEPAEPLSLRLVSLSVSKNIGVISLSV